mmetsp:Transcript_168719/g.542199  ORF Transcript_168719/g.542199 Transcript_168719/m.542199 type:complete len:240 (-) Transcript_168719:2-721(-)
MADAGLISSLQHAIARTSRWRHHIAVLVLALALAPLGQHAQRASKRIRVEGLVGIELDRRGGSPMPAGKARADPALGRPSTAPRRRPFRDGGAASVTHAGAAARVEVVAAAGGPQANGLSTPLLGDHNVILGLRQRTAHAALQQAKVPEAGQARQARQARGLHAELARELLPHGDDLAGGRAAQGRGGADHGAQGVRGCSRRSAGGAVPHRPAPGSVGGHPNAMAGGQDCKGGRSMKSP